MHSKINGIMLINKMLHLVQVNSELAQKDCVNPNPGTESSG